MSETPGYRAFVAAVQALPPDAAVYVRDFAEPFVTMPPARVLTEPEFVRYQGIRHAFAAEMPPEGSPFANAVAALGLRCPIMWYVTRGEPVATVLWERP